MFATSTAFAQMVEGVLVDLEYKVTIDLPGGAYPDLTLTVSKIEIEQGLSSNLPSATNVAQGTPSTTARFTLAGLVDTTDEAKTVEWLFNPYSTGSPLYRTDAFRAPVVVELGVMPQGSQGVPERLRKFVGYVDEYNLNLDGTVEFSCVDKRSDFRSVKILPAPAAPPYNKGLTPEFAIDYLLRAATNGALGTWPAQRPNCLVAAGMRASLVPERGVLDTSNIDASPLSFVQGVNGTAAHTARGTFYLWGYGFSAAAATAAATSANIFGEMTVTLDPTANDSLQLDIYKISTGAGLSLAFGTTTGQVTAVINLSGSYYSYTVPGYTLAPGTHHIEWFLTTTRTGSNTTLAGIIRIDSTTLTIPTQTAPAAMSSVAFDYVAITASGVTIEAFQIANPTSAPASNAGYTPTAILDRTSNPLDVIPPTEGDAWQAIQQIAAAELGAAGYLADPDTFRFWTYDHITSGGLARTVTSKTSLLSFGIGQSAAGVVNRAEVGYTQWGFGLTVNSTIYSATAVTRIPRGTTSFTITLDNAATRIDGGVSVLPNGTTTSVQSVYRASSDPAGNNEFPTTSLKWRLTQPAPDKVTVTVTNSNAATAYLVSPSNYTDITVGTPLFRIAGTSAVPGNDQTVTTQYPPAEQGGALSSKFGEVAYQLTGNPWIQDVDFAQGIGNKIVTDAARPVPMLTNVSIVPDPRLQLTDLIRIQDPDVSGIDEFARVFASTITLDAGNDGQIEYTHTIDARPVTFPGGWILGVDGRSELGVTTYL